jgi:Raf kinase inhibitor-like YbhB/YbcL family protein
MKKNFFLIFNALLLLIVMEVSAMEITSPAFNGGSIIPKKYTCQGDDVSPELQFGNIPDRAKSLVLIVEDPDTSHGTFVHWYGWNIPTSKRLLEQGEKLPVEGRNGFGDIGYRGPCPPPGKPHRYFFRLYALDQMLDLPEGTSKYQLEERIKGHIVDQAELMGTYAR